MERVRGKAQAAIDQARLCPACGKLLHPRCRPSVSAMVNVPPACCVRCSAGACDPDLQLLGSLRSLNIDLMPACCSRWSLIGRAMAAGQYPVPEQSHNAHRPRGRSRALLADATSSGESTVL